MAEVLLDDRQRPSFLFTNGAGNPVRAQEFYNGGWKPARDSAKKESLGSSGRRGVRYGALTLGRAAGAP